MNEIGSKKDKYHSNKKVLIAMIVTAANADTGLTVVTSP